MVTTLAHLEAIWIVVLRFGVMMEPTGVTVGMGALLLSQSIAVPNGDLHFVEVLQVLFTMVVQQHVMALMDVSSKK